MTERYQQIMGTELEWALSVKFQNKPAEQLSSDIGKLVDEYLRDDIVRVSGSQGMLSNGGRYYVDVGAHVEYATPENTTADGVVLSELAGERIIAESLRRFIADRVGVEWAALHKRVVDDDVNLWGYHINISEDRRHIGNIESFVQPLAMHYAASVPLFGAGAMAKVYVDGTRQLVYGYGQKALGLTQDISSNTTHNSKPIINTRDEPHADIKKHRRIHIVGNDPHISPWAARMAIGTYSLLLSAAREKKLPTIEPERSAHAMAFDVALDLECTKKHNVLVNGRRRKMTIIQIERMYIKAVKNVTELTAEQVMDLEEWERAVDDLERDVMSLRHRSDAIAKLALIRAKLERDHKDENEFDGNSISIDKDYTTVFRATKRQALDNDVATLIDKTTPAKLRARWFAADMPSEAQIQDRVINPPTTTRAYQRGNAIATGNVSTADWSKYTPYGGSTIALEPLEGRKPDEE